MALSLPKSNRAFVDAESRGKVTLRHPGERSRRTQLKARYEILRSMTHHASPFISDEFRKQLRSVAIKTTPNIEPSLCLRPAPSVPASCPSRFAGGRCARFVQRLDRRSRRRALHPQACLVWVSPCDDGRHD